MKRKELKKQDRRSQQQSGLFFVEPVFFFLKMIPQSPPIIYLSSGCLRSSAILAVCKKKSRDNERAIELMRRKCERRKITKEELSLGLTKMRVGNDGMIGGGQGQSKMPVANDWNI